MNETIELIMHRKSVRAFEDREVPADVKQQLFESALAAPTAGNMCLYTILDITDPLIKKTLSETCDHQPFIATAPVVLVFCCDYHRWFSLFKSRVETLRVPAEGDLLLAMDDALIAAQNVVLAAESLGLSSCYIGDILENYEVHRELLHLPKYVLPACLLVLGYPSKNVENAKKPPRFHVEDIVHENTYAEKDMEIMVKERGYSHGGKETIEQFCARKWNSDFSKEMSRSVRKMIEDWNA